MGNSPRATGSCAIFKRLGNKQYEPTRTFGFQRSGTALTESVQIGSAGAPKSSLLQDDSKCGFSFATFIRQATNARKEWLDSVCVRGRLCVPPSHWHRNIFSQPVAEAEVPADVASEFIFGKPWPISGLVG